MTTATSRRLTELYRTAPIIPVDGGSRIVFFGDSHRGDNSWADEFAHNQSLFFYALQHYFAAGFTYVELGDGDELWENDDFAEIRRAHSHIFWLLRQFYLDGRFLLLYGNHDIERQDPRVVARTLFDYYDERQGRRLPLFPDIQVHEALRLRYEGLERDLFLVHGHQGDYLNDQLWWFSRFVVRHFWRHVQLLGVNNPTSPAQNVKRRSIVEARITEWIAANDNQTLICGHTHRPRFPDLGAPPYYNVGSGIHPRAITGIELDQGEMMLVKWSIDVRPDGTLYVARTELVGPQPVAQILG